MGTARRKSGSAMSDRQMARAAVDGRLITFIQGLPHDPAIGLSGFLVGMDDFHWMIVPTSRLDSEDADLPVILVHKSCPFVMISASVTLSDYSEAFVHGVARIGRRFWEHCKQAHLGHTATTPQEKP